MSSESGYPAVRMGRCLPAHRRIVIGVQEAFRRMADVPLDHTLELLAPWATAYVGAVPPCWPPGSTRPEERR